MSTLLHFTIYFSLGCIVWLSMEVFPSDAIGPSSWGELFASTALVVLSNISFAAFNIYYALQQEQK